MLGAVPAFCQTITWVGNDASGGINSAVSGQPASQIAITYPQYNGQNNLLVARITSMWQPIHVTAVTDSYGNQWTKAVAGGSIYDTEIWYAINVNGPVSPALGAPKNTVTIQAQTAAETTQASIGEASGIAIPVYVDASNASEAYTSVGPQTSTPAGGTQPLTTFANDLVVGQCIGGLPAVDTSAGFKSGLPPFAVGVTQVDTYVITTTPGSYPVLCTNTGLPAWTDTVMAAFKGAVRPSLTVTTTTLPGGAVGTAYSQSLQATGGVSPYSWTISSGALPAGLTLVGNTISGIPTVTGTFNFTAKVTDSSGTTASAALSIVVKPAPLNISTASLPGGVVGAGYSQTLVASGGVSPYTWAVSSGALPGGLTPNASTGAISGTPTGTGTFNFTAKVTDSSGTTASAALSVVVKPAPLTITTTPLPGGTVGAAYSQSLAAAGGTGPYTWSISSGVLPGGLMLTANTISGNPTAAGTFNITVKSVDSSSPAQVATQNLSIVVGCPEHDIFQHPCDIFSGAVGRKLLLRSNYRESNCQFVRKL